MREILHEALDLLESGEPFALVTLVAQQGSTPRAAGAQMLVRPDGSIAGTIGGGLLEATMMREAAEAIVAGRSHVSAVELTGQSVAGPTMICGGHAAVLVAFVPAGDSGLRALLGAAAQARADGRAAWLSTFFAAEPGPTQVSYCLLQDGAEPVGELPSAPAELRALAGKIAVHGSAELADGRSVSVEALLPPTTAVICGAGHVAQALAPVAAAVGFDVVVLDDRPEFAAAERFPAASRVVRLETFEDAFAALTITPRSFVVIVTRGHAHDFSVLEQALRTPAGYIGLMGSASKRAKIFRALAADGFSAADLERVFSPIGVAIAAETPAELAVSITAELIRVRAAMVG
jgi:xanthine dehydrogenase accessory factor